MVLAYAGDLCSLFREGDIAESKSLLRTLYNEYVAEKEQVTVYFCFSSAD